LIGAAASGKSTAARILARHLQRPDQPHVRIISSAAIRQELYGDPSTLGCWAEVEAEIHRQLCLALAGGETVILDACYVKRSFRLAITQALVLPMAVQWVGWWLDTPLAQCLHWNLSRAHPVPELVIHKHCAHLLQAGPTPHRQEAFALVVRLQTGQGVPLETLIPRHLADLEPCIRRAANRDAAHQLHGYSRLLDQERLLYLIHLLSRYPKLTATTAPEPVATKGGSAARKRQKRGAQRLDSSNPPGDAADGAMEDLLAPLPPGGLAERAAALLGRLHGACYGDPAAVALDLDWLERQRASWPGWTRRWRQRRGPGSRCSRPPGPQAACGRQEASPAWPIGMPLGGCSPCCATCCTIPLTPHRSQAQAQAWAYASTWPAASTTCTKKPHRQTPAAGPGARCTPISPTPSPPTAFDWRAAAAVMAMPSARRCCRWSNWWRRKGCCGSRPVTWATTRPRPSATPWPNGCSGSAWNSTPTRPCAAGCPHVLPPRPPPCRRQEWWRRRSATGKGC
jgi:predicted kinase